MPRFFLDDITGEVVSIVGEDARHISKSLRMKPGEKLELCDKGGFDYNCEIISISESSVEVKILDKIESISEPTLYLKLYQAMPKGDKMEFIIQKAVELGVSEIIPVLSARCISRPDAKTFKKKLQRYEKIALEAAKQSRRGIIPEIRDMISYNKAIDEMSSVANPIIFYEDGGKRIPELLNENSIQASIMIGSEGGFDISEIEYAKKMNINIATLGKRILRCETAPLCAISSLMFYTKNI